MIQTRHVPPQSHFLKCPADAERGSGIFVWPATGTLTDRFGFRTKGGRWHNGLDIASLRGSPVVAADSGFVTFAGWTDVGYGNLVVIDHRNGYETRYAHLARIRVNVGERVSRGERIGDMGNSGRSTGTHLHYEVRLDGKPVNPMTYIKAARDVF